MEYNIEYEEGIVIQGKGNYCSKLKKGKLKTKKLLNQRAEPKQFKSDAEEICIYQNLESGHHCIYIGKIVGSTKERIPSNDIWK